LREKNGKSDDFAQKMNEFISRPGSEIAGLSLVVTDKEKNIFEGAWGSRRFDSSSEIDYPMLTESFCRIASISKTITTLVTLIMAEKGLLDIHRNLSDYLPWKLENPHFPGKSLSAVHMLTHCSGLRDGTAYNLPSRVNIASILIGEGSLLNWDSNHEPGSFFSYCNLGYGVLATALESITGRPFYILVEDYLLKQAGLEGNFYLNRLTTEELDSMATLYRKKEGSDLWIPQFDDLKGVKPLENPQISSNIPGTNGTLFAPHGGFRASALTLAKIIRLLLNKGRKEGKEIVSEKILSSMMKPWWHLEKGVSGSLNGESDTYHSRISGLGLFQIANESDEYGGDRILPEGGPRFWYHHGDAWGFLGGLMFDPASEMGFAYCITGTSVDPGRTRGLWSSNSALEEELQAQILRTFWS
jgi:CubicO group peptidase (beta-lactamase class C family)